MPSWGALRSGEQPTSGNINEGDLDEDATIDEKLVYLDDHIVRRL